MKIFFNDIAAATNGALKNGQGSVATGVSTDSRKVNAGDLFFALKGPNFDGHAFVKDVLAKGASGVVVDNDACLKGLPNGAAAVMVDDTLKALGALASHVRGLHRIPVIAITGSAGKTTTKEMAASILSVSRNVLKTEGNKNNLIGVPLTIFRFTEAHEAAVIELGISEDWEMERLVAMCVPDISLITNIGRGHLQTLGSLEGVARAKGPIFSMLPPHGVKVVNLDDPWVVKAAGSGGQTVTYSMKQKADVFVEDSSAGGEAGLAGANAVYNVRGKRITVKFASPGLTNAINGAAAIAAALSLGVPIEHMAPGLEAWTPVKGRMGLIRSCGFTVLDDTYNANPESMGSALRTLKEARGRKVAVLGDMLELGAASDSEHAGVGRMAAELGVDVLVAIGSSSETTAEGARRAGLKDVFSFGSKRNALALLKRILHEGDTVLVKGSRGAALEEVVEGLSKQ
jgi:UDP-N-acetylmuramoyl-tripeptide--D-alanyl-D-alanine ligase